MNRFSIFLVLLSLGYLSPAIAHQPMSNECTVPIRPIDDQNNVLWQQFLDEIEVFQACINASVAHQQNASREHQEAARLDVGRWNRFVKESLNVPEDIPWTPQRNTSN